MGVRAPRVTAADVGDKVTAVSSSRFVTDVSASQVQSNEPSP